MPDMKQTRQMGKIEDFLKEHEADPPGDLEKLKRLIRSATQESGSEAPPASSQDEDDD